MNKYTVKQLKIDISVVNKTLAFSGGAYGFEVGERNNITAVDLILVDEKGQYNCQRNIESGTPRECMSKVNTERDNVSKKLAYHQIKATRLQAYGVLYPHIEFTKDFHLLNSFEVEALLVWSKLCKYKKPDNAPHSTAHAFF